MTGKTHLAAGIITGELIILSTQIQTAAPATALLFASAIGSLLPDIDHPSSMLSTSNSATRALSSSVTAVTKHRGFTHTTMFVALITFLLKYVMDGKVPYSTLIAMGICAGMLSHLLLDTLNEKGVMWLWPFWRKPFYIAKIRTGSKVEDTIRVFLNILATVGLLYLLFLTVVKPYLPMLLDLFRR